MPAFMSMNQAQFDAQQLPQLCKSAQLHGHLLLRQILSAQTLLPLRTLIERELDQFGWLLPDQQGRLRAVLDKQLQLQGFDDPQWLALMQTVLPSTELRQVVHDSNLRLFLQTLLNTHGIQEHGTVIRVMFPHSAHRTPPHQEQFYLPNAQSLWNVWLPLASIGRQDGVIALAKARAPHSVLTHTAAQNGFPSVQPLPHMQWLMSPLDLGDVLLFHGLMLHQSLPNRGPWLRLSLDVRFGTA